MSQVGCRTENIQIGNSDKQICKCPPCNIQILIFAFQNFFECPARKQSRFIIRRQANAPGLKYWIHSSNLKIEILTGGLPAYLQDPRTDEHTGLFLKQENNIFIGNLLKHDFNHGTLSHSFHDLQIKKSYSSLAGNSMNICIRQKERGFALLCSKILRLNH